MKLLNVIKNALLYSSFIGILRWLVELERIDSTCEASRISSCIVMPLEGYFDHINYIFSYMKKYHNSRLVLDPTHLDIDLSKFEKKNWKQLYGDLVELVPPKMPLPTGNKFIVRAFVDADFGGDSLIRMSKTVFLVMINNAPLYWFSKKQSLMETNLFGRVFIAMK